MQLLHRPGAQAASTRFRLLRSRFPIYLWLLAGLAGLAPFLVKAPQQKVSLVGDWSCESPTPVRLLLSEGGGCTLRELAPDGSLRVSFGTYRVDHSTRPRTLRLSKLSGYDHSLHMLARLVEPDTLELSYTAPRWHLRPFEFSAGETLLLQRAR